MHMAASECYFFIFLFLCTCIQESFSEESGYSCSWFFHFLNIVFRCIMWILVKKRNLIHTNRPF